MELLETIDDILEQENSILPKKATKVKSEFSFDENLFSQMANFIINLDPDALSDDQVDKVIDMIEDLEVESGEEIQEVRRYKLARRSTVSKNQYSKKWYRKNRTSIRRRKAKFKRSSQGRKRTKSRERLARIGKTATGRKKVRYHVRKKGERRKKEEKKEI